MGMQSGIVHSLRHPARRQVQVASAGCAADSLRSTASFVAELLRSCCSTSQACLPPPRGCVPIRSLMADTGRFQSRDSANFSQSEELSRSSTTPSISPDSCTWKASSSQALRDCKQHSEKIRDVPRFTAAPAGPSHGQIHSQAIMMPSARPASSWLSNSAHKKAAFWDAGGGRRWFISDKDVASIQQFRLAQTGEGIAECELIVWHVKLGDEVKEFDKICEVQSDKASIEITSRFAGVIVAIHHQPGDIVKVGEVLVDIQTQGSSAEAETGDGPGGAKDEGVEADSAPELPSGRVEAPSATSAAFGGATSSRAVLATPPVRALAKELGIKIEEVPGTGPEGRVLEQDLRVFHVMLSSAGGEQSPAASVEDSHVDKVVPIRGYARAMAKSMAAALAVPHFTYHDDVVTDPLIAHRNRLREAASKGEESNPAVKLSYLPFIMKALSRTFVEFPSVNALVDDTVTSVTHKGRHNIGIAMDTPLGLVVPVLKDVQDKGVTEIAAEMARLQALAVAGGLQADDLHGGTFTVSNIGSIAGTYASPIVFCPQVAIVAFGKMKLVPSFDSNGKVVPVTILPMSWSADHRVVDGATVARCASRFRDILESPDGLV